MCFQYRPPCIKRRDSIKTLRDWRFDLPVTMATVLSCRAQFLFNFCNQITILFCIFSVLECPRCFCMSALTSKSWDEWHVRTQKQRGGEKRANLCLSLTASLHWYHANSGRAFADPWQNSGGTRISNQMWKQSGHTSTESEGHTV